MRRTIVALLIVAVSFAVVLLAGGPGIGASEVLIVLVILLATGIGPFFFGIVLRLLWKPPVVPLAVPWAFGVALGVIRLIAPQFGGLNVLESRPLSVLMTVILGAAFAELGLAAAAAGRQRRFA